RPAPRVSSPSVAAQSPSPPRTTARSSSPTMAVGRSGASRARRSVHGDVVVLLLPNRDLYFGSDNPRCSKSQRRQARADAWRNGEAHLIDTHGSGLADRIKNFGGLAADGDANR